MFFPLFPLFISLVRAPGHFELLVTSSSAPSSGRSLKACLKEPVSGRRAAEDQSCTFGGRETVIDWPETRLKLPFSFRWPGAFSLLLRFHSPELPPRSPDIISDARALPAANWSRAHVLHGHVLRYRVTCDHNYFGSDCALFCRSRDDGFGHFYCDTSGQKRCISGWTGDNCQTPICLAGCSSAHGFCLSPGECRCRSGWTGERCLECERHPGCAHGDCLGQPHACICRAGWGGLLCRDDLDFCRSHAPCLNGATCVNLAPNQFKCHCALGFAGINCERAIDACATRPCLHQATCSPTHNGTRFRCACAKGFEGTRCELDVDECASRPCANQGTCTDLIDGFRCTCAPGFTGSTCHEDVDECALSSCVHARECRNTWGGFECVCRPGWEGIHCETEINDCLINNVHCLNGGQCLDLDNHFRCACPPAFTGTTCQHVDPSACHAMNGALSWRTNATLCLCADAELKCRQMAINRNFRCQTNALPVTLELMARANDTCAALQAMHALLGGKESEFCCHVSNGTEVVFESVVWPEMRTFLTSGQLLGDFRQIADKRTGNGIFGQKIFVFSLIFVLFLIFVIIFLVFKNPFSRTGSESAERPEVIRNNLRAVKSEE